VKNRGRTRALAKTPAIAHDGGRHRGRSSRKIRRGRQKPLGLPLFYIDSKRPAGVNDTNSSAADEMETLASTFPDVLLCPEQAKERYMGFEAPYRSCRGGNARRHGARREIDIGDFRIQQPATAKIEKKAAPRSS